MDTKELESKIDKLVKDVSTYSERLTAVESENEKLKAENLKLKGDQKKFTQDEKSNEVKVFCEEQVKLGKMTPAQRDFIVSKENIIVFSETGASIVIPFDTFKEFIEKGGKIRDDKKFMKDDENNSDEINLKDPQGEVDRLVTEFCDEHSDKSYEDGINYVFKKYPKLAKAYTADASVTVSSDDE